jgi:hypothetical protein
LEVPVDPPATAPRDGAIGGAFAASACALLTFALASRWPPSLLVNVVGPPPLPAVLGAGACSIGIAAGALAGRHVVRVRGAAPRRAALTSALALFVAYLASIVASVATILVVDRGAAALMVPFSVVAAGLSVCLVLLPWAALPLGASAIMLEGWTRSAPGGIGVHARRRARCIAAVMAGASLALLAATWG